MFDQHVLAASVTLVLAADLGHGNVDSSRIIR